jgi:hypothetical protein
MRPGMPPPVSGALGALTRRGGKMLRNPRKLRTQKRIYGRFCGEFALLRFSAKAGKVRRIMKQKVERVRQLDVGRWMG